MKIKKNKAKETRSLITKAFKELRKNGYFARQNFWCCLTCGWSAIPDINKDKAVFINCGIMDHLREKKQAYIRWSGDRKFIEKILRKAGLSIRRTDNPNEETINVYKKN
ncbi:MAG: hypothetical protein WAZ12_01880 [Candidatus Absconditicoccaceae bacterium]